jgi:thiosulfate/3-mercaptopyruvate sulfurtransferase
MINRRHLLAAGIAMPGLVLVRSTGRASGTPIAADAWARPEWFADPEWIVDHRLDSAFRIVALTPRKDFETAHIPDAVQVDWPDLALTDSADATINTWRATVEQKLTDLGVIPASTVVIYDGGTFYGARLFWILDQLGHAVKRVLNGGFEEWTSGNREIETGPAEVQLAFEPYVGTPNDHSLARLNDVVDAVEHGTATLVDARTSEEYADGRIPGAINIPFLDNAEPDSGGRWKSPADLRAMYADKGVTPDKPIIPYCSTGVRSAVTWLTLSALGFPNIRLFSASFAEWSSDPTRPVRTGIG